LKAVYAVYLKTHFYLKDVKRFPRV